MPYSLNWLMGMLKKPDIFSFQNTKVTDSEFENITKAKIEFYRSFWGVSSVKENHGGVCTYSRKAVRTALIAPAIPRKYYKISHNYTPLFPFPNHQLFSIPGRTQVTDHGEFVLINVYFPPHFNVCTDFIKNNT